ncbi:hypothetical protein DYE48_10535 [Halobacillus trueperi]|uniref:Transmembrane protein n=1 Tax=Halobacillus trueperi TaxID=156205 RepID=A0A3E0J866_9BACI|nr:hypothetical protein DYE48_10535 [Halobacillus trueperi]
MKVAELFGKIIIRFGFFILHVFFFILVFVQRYHFLFLFLMVVLEKKLLVRLVFCFQRFNGSFIQIDLRFDDLQIFRIEHFFIHFAFTLFPFINILFENYQIVTTAQFPVMLQISAITPYLVLDKTYATNEGNIIIWRCLQICKQKI